MLAKNRAMPVTEVVVQEHAEEQQRPEPEEAGQPRHDEDVDRQADRGGHRHRRDQLARPHLRDDRDEQRDRARQLEPARMARRVEQNPDQEADARGRRHERGAAQVIPVGHGQPRRSVRAPGARQHACRVAADGAAGQFAGAGDAVPPSARRGAPSPCARPPPRRDRRRTAAQRRRVDLEPRRARGRIRRTAGEQLGESGETARRVPRRTPAAPGTPRARRCGRVRRSRTATVLPFPASPSTERGTAPRGGGPRSPRSSPTLRRSAPSRTAQGARTTLPCSSA